MAKYDYYATRNVSPVGSFINSRFRSALVETLKKSVPDGISICEVGAGRGELGEHLLALGYKYSCYEEAEGNVKILLGRVPVKPRRAPPFDEADGSVGAVIASHVLEHLRGPEEAMTFLQETARILVPNGHFLFAVPNMADLKELFFDSDWTHVYPTTPRRLDRLLFDAGFERVSSFHIRFGFSGYLGRIVAGFAKIPIWLGHFVLPDSMRDNGSWAKLRMLFIDNYCGLYKKRP